MKKHLETETRESHWQETDRTTSTSPSTQTSMSTFTVPMTQISTASHKLSTNEILNSLLNPQWYVSEIELLYIFYIFHGQ